MVGDFSAGIEISEGDDLTWLEVWRDHSAVARDHGQEPKVRLMAARIHQALESVLRESQSDVSN